MKDRREKNLLSYLFFRAKNFTKLNYFIFKMLKKKIWANFRRIIELFTQKIVTKISKIWVWDPVSGIRDPGSKRHPIPDPDPQHCLQVRHLVCVVEEHLTHLVDRDCGVDGAGQTHLTHQVRQCP